MNAEKEARIASNQNNDPTRFRTPYSPTFKVTLTPK